MLSLSLATHSRLNVFRSCLFASKAAISILPLPQHCCRPVPTMNSIAHVTTEYALSRHQDSLPSHPSLLPSMRCAICSEEAAPADSACTCNETAKHVPEQPDMLKGWKIASSDNAGIGKIKKSEACESSELRLQARSRRQSLQGESVDITKDVIDSRHTSSQEPWAAYTNQHSLLGLQHEGKLGLLQNINNLIRVHVTKCDASCQTPPELFPEVHNAHLCSSDYRLDPAALAASHVSRIYCPALEDVNQQFQPWLYEAHQMQAQHPDPFVFFPWHAFRFWPYPGWIPRDDSAG